MRSDQCPYYRPGVCPAGSRVVAPHGPEDSRVSVVGEAPGATENLRGVPFCGDSGQELDNLYLPAAGLRRDEVLVTNAVWCMPGRGKPEKPSAELVSHCSSHCLLPFLDRVRPPVVVALGRISGGLLGAPEPGVPKPSQWGGVLFGAPHPAAAMRGGSRAGAVMDEILLTFRSVARLIYNGDALPDPQPYEHRYCSSVREARQWLGDSETLSFDTETLGIGGEIYCMSMASRTGSGVRAAVLLDRETDWRSLTGWLRRRTVVMHNSLYDVEAVARRCGWEKAHLLLESVEDTMLLAYEIRGLPLGLKSLASVLCGLPMKTYEEALGGELQQALDARLAELEQFFRQAHEEMPACRLSLSLWPDPDEVEVPKALRIGKRESVSDYASRIRSLPDEELLPLAGAALRAPQGKGELQWIGVLAEEIDHRFSWLGAVEAVVVARMSLSGGLKSLSRALSAARHSPLLVSLLPESIYELVADCDRAALAAYAAQDAAATLMVWERLREMVE